MLLLNGFRKVKILDDSKKTGDSGREDGIFAMLTCVRYKAIRQRG